MGESLKLRGFLKGHGNWVTAIATSAEVPDMILTGSRDKTILVWSIKQDDDSYGYPKRVLTGHNHFVSDIAISSDGQFALSGSWDATLRLWEISTGKCTRRFVGHTQDVLSVAFSVDNRQIASASRDGTVKLWNTLGECKLTLVEGGHNGWVSCVRFLPLLGNPVMVSVGWDKLVKVWSLEKCGLKNDMKEHTGYLNTVAVAPDGSLCASGGKDGSAKLWDISEGKLLYSLEMSDIIHAMIFSLNHYWLVAATSTSIKIWDLETKYLVDEIKLDMAPTGKTAQLPYCTSLAWSADGNDLIAGYTDNVVRVFNISSI